MKSFKKGTPAFGVLLGCVFVGAAALIMWIGFWRTLLLAVLFCAGYFLGAVDKKGDYVREALPMAPEAGFDTALSVLERWKMRFENRNVKEGDWKNDRELFEKYFA